MSNKLVTLEGNLDYIRFLISSPDSRSFMENFQSNIRSTVIQALKCSCIKIYVTYADFCPGSKINVIVPFQ